MPLEKRSLSLSGHRTSLSLEPEFWAIIDAHVERSGVSLAGLIGQIDESRGLEPLASSVRVWAVRHIQSESGKSAESSESAKSGALS